MSSPTQRKVLLFGAEAEIAGAPFVWVEASGVEGLKAGVEAAAPALRGRIEHCRIAVNGEFVTGASVVGEGDEIALIGLVSGG